MNFIGVYFRRARGCFNPEGRSHTNIGKANLQGGWICICPILKFFYFFCFYPLERNPETLYSGKLLREKTFTDFTVLGSPVKVFSKKFGYAIHTFSLRNGHFLPNLRNLSPLKASCHTVNRAQS